MSIHTRNSEQLDEDLVLRVQRGDKSAFDFLVIKYQHKIIQLVNRYVKDPSEAQDVAQKLLLKPIGHWVISGETMLFIPGCIVLLLIRQKTTWCRGQEEALIIR